MTASTSRPLNRELWRRIYSRLLTRWPALALALVCLMGVAATQPLLALAMKPLLDQGFVAGREDYLWMAPAAIIAIFILRGLLSFSSDYLLSWCANGVLADMRRDMFERMLRLPDTYFKRNGSSALLNRFVVDAATVMQFSTEVFTVLVRETLIATALVGVLFYLSWKMTLVVLVLIPASQIITRLVGRRLRRINRETLNMNAELTRIVTEGIDGQRVIKLFNGYESEQRRFVNVNHRLRRFAIRNTVAAAATVPLTQTVAAISLAVVVWMALAQSSGNQITIGGFAAFVTAMLQMLDPLKRLANITGPMQRMLVAAESVFHLIDETVEQDTGARQLPSPVKGRIVYQDVVHQFPDAEQPTLRGVSFSVEPGQTVAFIGRSGSGKTTLVSMLPRFVEPSSGRIEVDGHEIHDVSLASLRSNISLVSQDVVLFDDTIANNVGYGAGRTPSREEIRAALEAANLLAFVDGLPHGMDSRVGENAARLSGGQRQRLAIARALIKNAPVLILDEATSALDNESERQVQHSLERLMTGRTTLVIAHRLSTVLNADRIIVLDEGRIVEQGTHAELIAQNALYASLYRMQFKD